MHVGFKTFHLSEHKNICCCLLQVCSIFIRFSATLINEISRYKIEEKSNRKAMNRNWSNQKANPALKTKTGNK